MPSAHEKLVAHTSHLLTAFIQLRERYALLHPMLFEARVPKQYGGYKQAQGFNILKTTLFLTCCQDIAKLAFDKFDKTPSLKRSVDGLKEPSLRIICKNRYVAERVILDDDDAPEVELAALYRKRPAQPPSVLA